MRKLGLVVLVALNLLLVAAAAQEAARWDSKSTPYEGKCGASEQC